MMCHAITALRDRSATYIIHCGDIGSPNMLDLFLILPNQHAAGFIFGNDDVGKCEPLRRRAGELGVHCFEFFGEFTMAGKAFAVVHGDDEHRLNELVSQRGHDYVLHGHTHVWRDEWIEGGSKRSVRIINPGALSDPRKDADGLRRKTCAMLDLDTGRLERIILAEAL